MKYLSFILLLLFCSCQSLINPDKPFICEIDGQTYKPAEDTSPIGGIGADQLTFKTIDGWLNISANNYPEFVGFRIKLAQSGRLEIKEYSGNDFKGTYISASEKSGSSFPSNSLEGKANITWIQDYEFKGTFEFKVKGQISGKTYNIAKGRFYRICKCGKKP